MAVIRRSKGHTRIEGRYADLFWIHSAYAPKWALEQKPTGVTMAELTEDGIALYNDLDKWIEIRDMLSMMIDETQDAARQLDNLGDYQKDEAKESSPDHEGEADTPMADSDEYDPPDMPF